MPRRSRNKRVNPLLIAAMFLMGAAAIVGGYILYKQPEKKYVRIVRELPAIKRDVMEPAPPSPVANLFSKENVTEYEKGVGFIQPLVITYDGVDEFTDNIELKPWEWFEQTTNPIRREVVIPAAQKEAEGKYAAFANYQLKDLTFEVYIDDTSGITPGILTRIREAREDNHVGERLQKGGGQLYIFRLSNTDSVRRQLVEATPGDASVEQRVKDAFTEATANNAANDNAEKDRSAIAMGLFNAMRANAGKKNRRILIISDGAENNDDGTGDSADRTVNIYKRKDLLKPDKREELISMLTVGKRFTVPDLQHAKIDWYVVPARNKAESDFFSQLQDMWKDLFSRAGVSEFTTHK